MATINKVNVRDIYIHQGATRQFTLKLKDNNDVAKNLSGYTVEMTIKKHASGESILELDSDGNGITLTGASGQMDFLMTAAQTAAFDFVEGVFDVKLTSGASSVTYILRGKVIVTRRVTI